MSRDGGIARRYKRNKQMIPFAKRLLKEMSIPCCLNNDPSVSLAADSSLYAREPRGLGASCFGLEVSGPCRNSFPALRFCALPTNMGD